MGAGRVPAKPPHWRSNLGGVPSADPRADRSNQLAALAIGIIIAALALFAIDRCGTGDEGTIDVEVTEDLDPGLVPTPAEPVPETTDPVVEPTVVPTPTRVAIPTPTPMYGPTGRPTAAGATAVLTAGSTISRPTVYDAPDGDPIEVTYTYLNGNKVRYQWFTNPTYFNNPLALMVLEGDEGDEWAKVQIPTRPAMEGWVKTGGFSWSVSEYYIRINISDNTVTVWNGDEIIVDQVSVVTGDLGRETPVATTFVDEIMPGHSSAYGPWMLSLGVFSDAINTFSGGLPKTAMHGTNRPDLLGQYASNGCIRLPNDVITLLADQVPVGTRVDLVRDT